MAELSMAEQLPIQAVRGKILQAFAQSRCLLIIGETGSGKTTQIPQFIYDQSKDSRIAVTQPRRVAAVSLARRVAQERGCPVGTTVGYSVRFDERSSKETAIKYLTDGMLLKELLSDKTLRRYSCVILDEAHERTLRTDILFGMLKRIQTVRSDLRIVIMSATLDPRRFLEFFPGSSVLQVPGRQFPVRMLYAEETQLDYLDAAVVSVVQLHEEKPAGGDILVFLTGQDEIDNMARILEEHRKSFKGPRMLVCPIYASMPSAQQMSVFKPTPHGCRKVILATNIAETSITIPGIKYVIDPGFVKQRQYSPRTGMESLQVLACSQSSAKQRAGRAGRDGPGECYRLYPEEAFAKLDAETAPEIRRTNLSNVILVMKAAGVEDVLGFDYLDRPSEGSLKRGLEELLALGALDKRGTLSRAGVLMAECPLAPTLSRVLLESAKHHCTQAVISILSLLSADSLFITSVADREQCTAAKRAFAHKSGDHMTLLNVWKTWEATADADRAAFCTRNCLDGKALANALDIRRQLLDFAAKHRVLSGNDHCEDSMSILRSFTAGFFLQVAFRQPDNSFLSLGSRQQVHIHPSSVLFLTRTAECVIYHEMTVTTRSYMRTVSAVSPEWILEFSRRQQ